jgi:hypothetical protein
MLPTLLDSMLAITDINQRLLSLELIVSSSMQGSCIEKVELKQREGRCYDTCSLHLETFLETSKSGHPYEKNVFRLARSENTIVETDLREIEALKEKWPGTPSERFNKHDIHGNQFFDYEFGERSYKFILNSSKPKYFATRIDFEFIDMNHATGHYFTLLPELTVLAGQLGHDEREPRTMTDQDILMMQRELVFFEGFIARLIDKDYLRPSAKHPINLQ